MARKFARFAFVFILLGAGTFVTVVDHLLIGFIIFLAMIMMVATGPKPGETEDLSEMARARRARN